MIWYCVRSWIICFWSFLWSFHKQFVTEENIVTYLYTNIRAKSKIEQNVFFLVHGVKQHLIPLDNSEMLRASFSLCNPYRAGRFINPLSDRFLLNYNSSKGLEFINQLALYHAINEERNQQLQFLVYIKWFEWILAYGEKSQTNKVK